MSTPHTDSKNEREKVRTGAQSGSRCSMGRPLPPTIHPFTLPGTTRLSSPSWRSVLPLQSQLTISHPVSALKNAFVFWRCDVPVRENSVKVSTS